MKSATPEWLAGHVVGTGTFTFESEEFEYVIIRSDVGSAYGAPRVFTVAGGSVLAISDEYPEQWRELGLIHEIFHYHFEPPLTCIEALRKELVVARERGVEMSTYLQFRLKFFVDMVNFYVGMAKRSPQQNRLLGEMFVVLRFLQAQCGVIESVAP